MELDWGWYDTIVNEWQVEVEQWYENNCLINFEEKQRKEPSQIEMDLLTIFT
jgi:hypothetical protein